MVRLGINLMAWAGGVGPAEIALFPRLKALGYDGVELPLLQPDAIDAPAIRAALAGSGLAATASGALPRGTSLLDPAERDRAIEWVDRCLRCAAACGATLFCGPLCLPVGQMSGRPPTAAERASCVVGLREIGRRAADRGMTVALEVLNRFETYFMNTADDALSLIEEVESPAIGLHLDTFHTNIEEKDPAAALRRAGAHLAHVHFSENDRGVVGSGHIDWPAARRALRANGYLASDRWIMVETFAGAVPEIAAATAIWRTIVPDPWSYAHESISFTRRLLEESS